MIEDYEQTVDDMLADVSKKLKAVKDCKPSEKNAKMDEIFQIITRVSESKPFGKSCISTFVRLSLT